MAIDKIHSILHFTGIAIGDTQTLPHGLVLRGDSLLPDFVFLQFADTFELVSADTTNVTIRNTANTGGDCDAYVFCLHPAIRLLGLSPDDGLMTQGMTPRPFCPGSPNGGSGGGGDFNVVVFRPGGMATANVVTTWADALALLSQLEGTRYLEFDDSITSPIPIPVGGPYDMIDVTWAAVPDRVVLVEVPEGVSFTGLRTFSGRLQISFTGTTAPVDDFASPAPQIDTVTMSDGALISCTVAPFFHVADDAQFWLNAQAGLAGSGVAVVDIDTALTVSIFAQGAACVLSDDTVSGAVGATLNLVRQIDAPFSFSEDQSAFLGTLNPINHTQDITYPTTTITSNTGLTVASQLVLVNPTGGAFSLTLPLALRLRGQSILVKNISASVNNVTVLPGGGDTIDGAASLVMSGDHWSLRVTSNGSTTWYVTAA